MNSKNIYILTIIYIIFYTYFYNYSFVPRLLMNSKKGKYIFTFWEPEGSIPGYLELCIKTWHKYLYDYRIIILNYNLVRQLLGQILFDNIICENMSLAVQADAIRVALLYKYGGFWIDTDVIILGHKNFKKFVNYELMMIRDEKSKHNFICLIYAKKGSIIMHDWLEKIIEKVQIYKYNFYKKHNKKNIKINKKINSLNYLGNSIIDPLLKNITDKKYLILDIRKMNVFPERQFNINNTLEFLINSYRDFYFSKGDHHSIITNTKGIIYLHNSWTPKLYKNMSEKEFLEQDILLSKLFAEILHLK